MLTILRRVALALALVLPTVVYAGTPPTEERMEFLMKWAADALDVPSRGVSLPPVLFASEHAIQVEFYGAEVVLEAAANEHVSLVSITAVYNGAERYMVINQDADFTDPANEYILVHELAHHLQYAHGEAEKAPCVAAIERDAYRVSDLWVRATGHGVLSDPLSVMVFSSCPSWR